MLIFPVYGTYRLETLKIMQSREEIGRCLLVSKLHVTITGAAVVVVVAGVVLVVVVVVVVTFVAEPNILTK